MNYKLLIKLFIASEAFFFLSLILAYVYFWQSSHFSGEALQHLSTGSTGFFTALLIFSSFTFWLAERKLARGKMRGSRFWLFATLALGIIFISGQAHEYYKLLNENITLSKDGFGSSFFTLTGFHGLHVILGLIVLGIIFGLSVTGNFSKENHAVLAAAGIYWHFVDVVWIVVFSLIYILPHFIRL